MICYKDQTFCSHKKCINTDCFRHWSLLRFNKTGLPYAISDFSKQCSTKRYTKNE